MQSLKLFCWSRSPRIEITRSITDAVSAAGGFVLESHRYSNNALVLRFELPARRCAGLVAAVGYCDVTFDAESIVVFQQLAEWDVNDENSVTGIIHLRFLHDEPDLRIEMPAVPG